MNAAKKLKRPAPVPLSAPGDRHRRDWAADLDRIKNNAVWQEIWDQPDPEITAVIHHAANDARALAWATAWPQLFFPALLEEKLAEARKRITRQQFIRNRTEPFLNDLQPEEPVLKY